MSFFIFVICMYLHILVSNMISILDDVSSFALTVNSNKTGVTYGTGTANPSGAPTRSVLHILLLAEPTSSVSRL